jgi:hypothetical protein
MTDLVLLLRFTALAFTFAACFEFTMWIFVAFFLWLSLVVENWPEND